MGSHTLYYWCWSLLSYCTWRRYFTAFEFTHFNPFRTSRHATSSSNFSQGGCWISRVGVNGTCSSSAAIFSFVWQLLKAKQLLVVGTTPSNSELRCGMKAWGSALQVTWKKANVIFLSQRGYKIKEHWKAFQESTLFGLLVLWDQIVQWLLPLAVFFPCYSDSESGNLSKGHARYRETPAVLPKAFQHPACTSP